MNLRAFLVAAKCGSFSEAARQLNVVPSVVAKRIGDLEHTVGARLFTRSTRRVALTESGHKFQTSAGELVAEFDHVIQSLKRDEGRLEGHIRLKVPTTLAVLYLAEVFSAFQREHPRITMEILLIDRSVNPVEEGFDVAIGGRAASYEGVIDIPLCPLRQILCAAPAYLHERGVPTHPRELADHDCLIFKPTGSTWQFDSDRGPITVDVPQRLSTNDNSTLLAAARAGNGVAILPTYVANTALANEELTPLLADYPLQSTWLKALVPRKRQGLPQIDALIEWLTRSLADSPPWDAD
ncbi:LysR family transcriptional regulator [Burkholderia diffusa]|uniref:LysR family transcriptional regulator n=1 Tax=Burkholderia diffusa TaxID=488732 RepID=UPI0018C65BC9|nr:LysR family transcriptional regulator [Burkholderia diffusa]